MRKILLGALLLCALLITAACGNNGEAEEVTIRVAALRGPTAMGLLQLMDLAERGEANNRYEFELLGAPVEVAPLLVGDAVDVAVVPGNLAAVLYNQMDGAVQGLAVVTLGVLHIVDATGEVNTIEDLRGRTVFLTGAGATPEFALNYVLLANGLVPNVDVYLEFRAEAPEIAAAFELGVAEVALLPEPFVSTVLGRFDFLRVAMDLTEEWNRVQSDYGLIMSVVIARREFLENYPEAVAAFMDEYAASIAFMNTELDAAAQLVVDAGLVPAVPIARSALPRTNMVFITGAEMQRSLTGFFRVLYEAHSPSVGGRVPDADFFFIR